MFCDRLSVCPGCNLPLSQCMLGYAPASCGPAQNKHVHKKDGRLCVDYSQTLLSFHMSKKKRNHSTYSAKHHTKSLYTWGVSHHIHLWCSDIIDTEMRRKKNQTNPYLWAEMLISGFCLWKRYKWLISMGPLRNKQALCLCSFLLLCLSTLWRVVSESTGLISW